MIVPAALGAAEEDRAFPHGMCVLLFVRAGFQASELLHQNVCRAEVFAFLLWLQIYIASSRFHIECQIDVMMQVAEFYYFPWAPGESTRNADEVGHSMLSGNNLLRHNGRWTINTQYTLPVNTPTMWRSLMLSTTWVCRGLSPEERRKATCIRICRPSLQFTLTILDGPVSLWATRKTSAFKGACASLRQQLPRTLTLLCVSFSSLLSLLQQLLIAYFQSSQAYLQNNIRKGMPNRKLTSRRAMAIGRRQSSGSAFGELQRRRRWLCRCWAAFSNAWWRLRSYVDYVR